MADEVTLHQLIVEVLETGEEDDDQAAKKIIDLTLGRHRKLAPMILHGIVADEVRRIRRNHVRKLERGGGSRRSGATTEAADPVAARAAWLAEGFYIPSKGRVLWGDATAADHRERIEFLTAKATGIQRTIRRHELALKAIEADPDAECLSDIDGLWDLDEDGDNGDN